MQEIPIVLGFTAGELSPWLDARIDLQAYQRGAGRLSNFTVLPYGGIRRRRGTRMVDYAENQEDGATRLVPFRYSESDVLMLEFSPGTMRAFKDGWGVRTPDERDYYRLTIPWTTAEQIESLRFTQINDVLFVTCPTHPVVKISRLSNNNWTVETVVPEPYPRASYAINNAGLQVTFSADGTTATLELDESAPSTFLPAMEGAEFLLADADAPERTYLRNESTTAEVVACPNLSTTSVAAGTKLHLAEDSSNQHRLYTCRAAYNPAQHFVTGKTSPADYPQHFMPGIMRLDNGKPYEVCGDWEIATHGEWNASWELRRSYNTVADDPDCLNWDWVTIKSFSQSAYEERRNWALSGSEKTPCRMVPVCISCVSLPVSPMMYFRTLAGQREYKFRITSVASGRKATAAVVSPYLDSPAAFRTTSWSLGAFGTAMGYPAFSSYYQNRLWFGGIPGLPTTLFGSAVDDFSNFRMGSDADDALHLTLASDDQSRINWMCATRELLVGTAEGEWALTASDNGPICATSAAYKRQSAVGSEPLPVQAVENSVLFVQRGGRRLREISYKLETDGFSTVDLSLLAEHLFHSGVAEWCVQRGTDSYIWMLMKDSSLAVLTMNMEQQVTAWQRINLPGRTVHHIAALPSASGEDEIWFVVEFNASHLFMMENISSSHELFVDTVMGVSVEADGVFRNMLQFAGSTVYAWRENDPDTVYPTEVDSEGNGVITAPDMRPTWQSFFLGRPYVSELRTMPLERELSFNAVRQLSRVKLRLLESDPRFRYKSTASPRWEVFDPAAIRAEHPFTGAIRIPQMPDAAVGQSLVIAHDGIRDFALQALTVEVDQHGR